jgi:hypothetical protein
MHRKGYRNEVISLCDLFICNSVLFSVSVRRDLRVEFLNSGYKFKIGSLYELANFVMRTSAIF